MPSNCPQRNTPRPTTPSATRPAPLPAPRHWLQDGPRFGKLLRRDFPLAANKFEGSHSPPPNLTSLPPPPPPPPPLSIPPPPPPQPARGAARGIKRIVDEDADSIASGAGDMAEPSEKPPSKQTYQLKAPFAAEAQPDGQPSPSQSKARGGLLPPPPPLLPPLLPPPPPPPTHPTVLTASALADELLTSLGAPVQSGASEEEEEDSQDVGTSGLGALSKRAAKKQRKREHMEASAVADTPIASGMGSMAQ